ncbi:MAG TPA: hypothetical protein VGE04_19030 [Chloroflexia bacterium]|jgi:hypothetical protein
MSDPDYDEKTIGSKLWEDGWRQGSMFYASSAYLTWNAFPADDSRASLIIGQKTLGDSELFIVATQDCDIVAPATKEPFIEAFHCTIELDQNQLGLLDRNSARWFVVQPSSAIVANAMDRILFSKYALTKLKPISWSSGQVRLQRYIGWLARRFDRPAIPDALVSVFQKPVEKVFESLSRKQPHTIAVFNRAVSQMRINVPSRTVPPFDIQIILLTREDNLTAEEHDAILAVIKAIRDRIDKQQVRLIPDAWIVTEAGISLADYNNSRPLALDYLTYQGDIISGSQPPNRA